MTAEAIRIGTRGSALALAQAHLVAAALGDAGLVATLVVIETAGDKRAPDTAWGEGAFVTAIEQALLAGTVDVAVHSAKDVPTEEDPRLAIAAFLPRADPRDALVVRDGVAATSVADLPHGAVVGTDSPRRAGFLRGHRPDLSVVPLHGNVDTRLRRLDTGTVDAAILAVAGLTRLGREDRITERIDPRIVPPAPGQGAIAVQVRADDAAVGAAVGRIDDEPTRLAVLAERAFLRAAGGGCRAPVGALARIQDGRVVLSGGFATIDGSRLAVGEIEGEATSPEGIAAELAARLGAQIELPPDAPRVLVTRAAGTNDSLVRRLAALGVEARDVPAIAIERLASDELGAALADLPGYAWAIVTSANGADAVVAAASGAGRRLADGRWAAVGRASASALTDAGARSVWLPTRSNATTVAAELPIEPGDRVLLVRGSLADVALPKALTERGASVREVVAYRTIEAPDTSRIPMLEAIHDGIDAIVFTSGSAVRGALRLAGRASDRLFGIPAVCIGPTTSAEARAAGFRHVVESPSQDAGVLAEIAADLVRTIPAGATR